RAAARAGSDVSKHSVEGTRHVGEIQRLDEQARVADLPAPAAAHEPAELICQRLPPPGRLLLKRAERAEVAVRLEDLLDGLCAERADQLVLQVLDTDVEAQLLHLVAAELGAE